jgi:hypothetical protein
LVDSGHLALPSPDGSRTNRTKLFKIDLQGSVVKMEPGSELTRILGRARAGDERARDELIALVYEELRQVVSRLMRRGASRGHWGTSREHSELPS